jgi:hypothetical protein
MEALAEAAAELEASLPARVEHAVEDGLRAQVLPVARQIAEVRGLANQLLRRLERIEGDTAAERHARVDDLALLVDLITSGWQSVDRRLARTEQAVARVDSSIARLEQNLEQRGGAIVYRMEDRRPEAAG